MAAFIKNLKGTILKLLENSTGTAQIFLAAAWNHFITVITILLTPNRCNQPTISSLSLYKQGEYIGISKKMKQNKAKRTTQKGKKIIGNNIINDNKSKHQIYAAVNTLVIKRRHKS